MELKWPTMRIFNVALIVLAGTTSSISVAAYAQPSKLQTRNLTALYGVSYEAELDKIDFRDKTVLDIGCWDGFWSFYAEQRGAKRVLATDDSAQNWAGEAGFFLAKELLKSTVECNLRLSVYELEKTEWQV